MPVQSPNACARVAILSALLFSANVSANEFTVTTDIVVQTGQPSPDGNGVFSDTIQLPVLNDAGEVLIWANLLATSDPGPLDDWGFFVADRTAVTGVFRGGEPSAQGNPLRLDPPAVTSSTFTRPYGLDAFGRIVLAAPDSLGGYAVYRDDGIDRQVIAQDGDSTALGTLADIDATVPGSLRANDAGQASFLAFLSVPDLPTQDAWLRADSGGSEPLLYSGQALPDGRTVANLGLLNAVLNNSGRVASTLNTSGSGLDSGLYASDGDSVVKLLHTGEPAPDGLGTLLGGVVVFPLQQNDSGKMLAMAQVDDISQDYVGLFSGSGSGLSEVTRTGALSPDGPILNLTGQFLINDNDTLVFGAVVTTPQGNIEQLIMRRSDVMQPIVSAFSVLPDPIGMEVRSPFQFVINESDQVMFSAFVLAEGFSRRGLFLFDPEHGLALVARVGQAFAGDVIEEIEVALPRPSVAMIYTGNAQNAFNNFGEQAFYYRLQNGQAGVALAAVEFVPEDSDLLFKDGFE